MDGLLKRLRLRDPEAFREAVVRYAPPLQRVLTQLLRNPVEAEDVVQEAFARLFLRIDSVQTLRPWLFQVGMNLARTQLRRQALPPAESPAPPAPADPAFKELIDGAVAHLPEKARSSFLLREVGGMTTDEVAAVEGCSPEAVRQRVMEARRKLRELLRPHLKPSHLEGV